MLDLGVSRDIYYLLAHSSCFLMIYRGYYVAILIDDNDACSHETN